MLAGLSVSVPQCDVSGLLSLSVIFSFLLVSCILQLLLSSPQNLLGCLKNSPCNLDLLSQMGELRVLAHALEVDSLPIAPIAHQALHLFLSLSQLALGPHHSFPE